MWYRLALPCPATTISRENLVPFPWDKTGCRQSAVMSRAVGSPLNGPANQDSAVFTGIMLDYKLYQAPFPLCAQTLLLIKVCWLVGCALALFFPPKCHQVTIKAKAFKWHLVLDLIFFNSCMDIKVWECSVSCYFNTHAIPNFLPVTPQAEDVLHLRVLAPARLLFSQSHIPLSDLWALPATGL